MVSEAPGYETTRLPRKRSIFVSSPAALPSFLLGRGEASAAEIAAGLDLTGYFIVRALFAQGDKPVPAARDRFVERCRRRVVGESS